MLPVLLVLGLAGKAHARRHLFISPGHEKELSALFSRSPQAVTLKPHRVKSIQIERDVIKVTFHNEKTGDVQSLRLRHPQVPCLDCFKTRGFTIHFDSGNRKNRALAQRLVQFLGGRVIKKLWFAPKFFKNLADIESVNYNFVILRIIWGVLLLLLLFALAREGFRGGHRAFHLALLLLLAGGFLLRYFFANWGPGNSWAQLNQAIAGIPHHYGDAPTALIDLTRWLFPATDTSMVVVNLIMGALAPVVMALFLLHAGTGVWTAFAGGVLLCLQPLLMNQAGGQSRNPYVVLLGITALWNLARYHRFRRLRDLVAFPMAAVLCCLSRPEGFMILPMLLAFTGLNRRRGAPPDFKYWVVYGVLLLTVAMKVLLIYQLNRQVITDGAMLPSAIWLNPWMTPIVFIVLLIMGTLWGILRRSGLVGWAWASLLVVMVFSLSFPAWGRNLGYAQYQTMSLIPFAAVGALGGAWAFRLLTMKFAGVVRRVFLLMLFLSLVVLSYKPYVHILPPITFDHEYNFVRKSLKTLPPRSTIYYVYQGTESIDLGLKVPHYLSAFVGSPLIAWKKLGQPPWHIRGPSYFYRQGTCSIDPSRYNQNIIIDNILRRCALALKLYGHQPVKEAVVPARTFQDDHYRSATIRLGFYEMQPRRVSGPKNRQE